ncbi:MAG: beta-ketoacyl-[acyl-carrier-protein] synthase family protein [Thermoguttaceae bacterium]
MALKKDIVVTGVGVVSPIGIGVESFWASLCEGRSGVRRLNIFDDPKLIPFGGEIVDFDPKKYVRHRKSLKVMSRDIQLAYAAADMACQQSKCLPKLVDPERLGIVFGADMMPCELHELVSAYRSCLVDGRFDFSRWGEAAMTEIFPLWMLKYLPNMPACHIGIAQDARGPNNTLTLDDVSGLSAVAEAVRVIERGAADAMIAGGAGSRVHPTFLFRSGLSELSRRGADPAGACRPFDATRDGMVYGEGAAAVLLEGRAISESRGAAPLARVLGYGSAFEPSGNGRMLQGLSIRKSMQTALRDAGISAAEVGCVVAHGLGTTNDDRREAAAIRDVLGETAVTAPKSYYGHPGTACGAVEMVLAILILRHRLIPPTLNYRVRDPSCPIRVVHGQAQALEKSTVLILSHTQHGQAVTMILADA